MGESAPTLVNVMSRTCHNRGRDNFDIFLTNPAEHYGMIVADGPMA
jgi:hypothetical protein